MSLILKGIDLPKDTVGVKLSFQCYSKENDTIGLMVISHIEEQYVMLDDIIQIPKGHGRIGDLDELQVNVTKAMTYGDALHEIKKAPAILESEVMPDE